MVEDVEVLEDILTENEEVELRSSLDHMVEAVKTYCEKNGKVTASEKRIIKAMQATTDDLTEEIVKLYKDQTQVDDMTLLEVVNKNREKILNDLLFAALTPKKHKLSEEAKEVITMVAKELI
ncbi:MAG: hypothetical protein GPJ51_11110 [Candidatus Heimdallarchaeota archaeon]|nr:hypothetical protein [Candidatus Heimdallarchaeota archaeon]